MTLAPDREKNATTALAEQLRDPKVAASLAILLDHADLLAVLVQGLDGFLERSEVIGDSLLASLGDLRTIVGDAEASTGIDLQQLTELKNTATSLMSSDLLKPEALDAIGLLARGAAKGSRQYDAQPVHVGGIFSLAKLLKDPDISRALSFVATLGKAIGQELNAPPPATTPPTSSARSN